MCWEGFTTEAVGRWRRGRGKALAAVAAIAILDAHTSWRCRPAITSSVRVKPEGRVDRLYKGLRKDRLERLGFDVGFAQVSTEPRLIRIGAHFNDEIPLAMRRPAMAGDDVGAAGQLTS